MSDHKVHFFVQRSTEWYKRLIQLRTSNVTVSAIATAIEEDLDIGHGQIYWNRRDGTQIRLHEAVDTDTLNQLRLASGFPQVLWIEDGDESIQDGILVTDQEEEKGEDQEEEEEEDKEQDAENDNILPLLTPLSLMQSGHLRSSLKELRVELKDRHHVPDVQSVFDDSIIEQLGHYAPDRVEHLRHVGLDSQQISKFGADITVAIQEFLGVNLLESPFRAQFPGSYAASQVFSNFVTFCEIL